MTLRGDRLDGLQLIIEEHYEPGQMVELAIGIPDIYQLEEPALSLIKQGLLLAWIDVLSIQEGSLWDWAQAIKINFKRQRRGSLVKNTISNALINTLASVGVPFALGWRLESNPVTASGT